MHPFRRTALALAMSGTLATPATVRAYADGTENESPFADESEQRTCEVPQDFDRAVGRFDVPCVAVLVD